VTSWQRLERELDAWRDEHRRPTLWCRDDDACGDTPALRRLLQIAHAADIPVALAVIPAALEPGLVDALEASSRTATVVQHGYAHRNHAPPGARNWELGAHRPVAAIVAEIELGRIRLQQSFGTRYSPVLVPPWNRIDPELIAHLPDMGMQGLSVFGPRPAPCAVPGIVQCNTHVDLVDWRRDRAFIGVDRAIDRLVGHLQARRDGSVDAAEPSGILTHHLVLDDAAWQFLADLAERTRAHGAAEWLDVRAAFGAGNTAPALV